MKHSLRVLVISLEYPPCSIGGYEVMCAQVCAWLHQSGHDVQVLTSVPLAVPPIEEDVWRAGSIPVRRTLRSYWDGRDCLYPPFREALVIEQANQAQLQSMLAEYRPDVISFWHMGAMSLGLITTTLRLGYPIVFVIGDDWLCYGGWADAWLRGLSYHPQRARAVERLTGIPTHLPDLGAAGMFCFVSDYTRRRAEDVGGWRFPHFDITRPGVSPTEFPPLAAAREHPWRWRLLWPGRVTEEKGIETAVKALGLLPQEAVLEIVGPVEPTYRRSLLGMASALDVADRLTFSLTSRQEMRTHYQQADITLFTSKIEHEAFGLVPLEAMASGCPVVATCVGGSGEYCLDEVNCLRFAAGDADSLAFAIQQLATNPDLRRRLIEGGLRTARELTLDRQAKQIEQWLLTAATGHT
jgi:glycogen synthase